MTSVAVFGWNVHRTYLHEILPWALHGGGLQPYQAAASLSGVLHYLFLSEPQWNLHPWHYSPLCYALVLSIVQILVMAPVILFIRTERSTQERVLLEWSALVTAALAVSTIPASYNFVLMVFPACAVAAELLRRRWHLWLTVLLGLSGHRISGSKPARDERACDPILRAAASADVCAALRYLSIALA